jgi:hypothetical protein
MSSATPSRSCGYLSAILGAFGIDVDYAQLIKHYGAAPDAAGPERKYSPGECCGISKRRVLGKPLTALVSTSYVEKHNQAMRQHMKRFNRLTAAHSKKIENHVHMVALCTTWYNSPGSILRSACLRLWQHVLRSTLWDSGDIVKLIEDQETPGFRV